MTKLQEMSFSDLVAMHTFLTTEDGSNPIPSRLADQTVTNARENILNHIVARIEDANR